LYVDDAARGIVLAAERYEKPDPINLGSAQELTIRELVDMIARLTGYDGRITWDRTKPDGQPRRKLNVDRARREFGFESSVDFEDGLLRTIKSYSAASAPTASGEILEAKQSSD
jgi:nucleoside-diphosphate-sugar epimerase